MLVVEEGEATAHTVRDVRREGGPTAQVQRRRLCEHAIGRPAIPAVASADAANDAWSNARRRGSPSEVDDATLPATLTSKDTLVGRRAVSQPSAADVGGQVKRSSSSGFLGTVVLRPGGSVR